MGRLQVPSPSPHGGRRFRGARRGWAGARPRGSAALQRCWKTLRSLAHPRKTGENIAMRYDFTPEQTRLARRDTGLHPGPHHAGAARRAARGRQRGQGAAGAAVHRRAARPRLVGHRLADGVRRPRPLGHRPVDLRRRARERRRADAAADRDLGGADDHAHRQRGAEAGVAAAHRRRRDRLRRSPTRSRRPAPTWRRCARAPCSTATSGSINGQKMWNTMAHMATHNWVAVRTEPDAPKHKGISMMIVPMDAPGVTRAADLRLAGPAHQRALPRQRARAARLPDRRARHGLLLRRHGAQLRAPVDRLGRRWCGATSASWSALVRELRRRRPAAARSSRGCASAWRGWRSTSKRRACSASRPPGRSTRAACRRRSRRWPRSSSAS